MGNTKDLDLCIKVDDEKICELNSNITQENIITTVKTMKQQLLDNNLDQEKIFIIYDISIEMLQNILKYSYGNMVDDTKKREADGQFTITYNSTTKEFVICGSNLITKKQSETISQRVDELKGLNEKEMRKLMRSKMKSRRDGHADGAGLGFVTIASKTPHPIKVTFEQTEEKSNDTVKYRLEVKV